MLANTLIVFALIKIFFYEKHALESLLFLSDLLLTCCLVKLYTHTHICTYVHIYMHTYLLFSWHASF